jgi:hypothetical protein
MVERDCLHGSTKENESVDSKMVANEIMWQGFVLKCDY